MADLPPYRESTTGTPRWVKVSSIIVLAVVLLFVFLLFTRGPDGRGLGVHGPGRHTSSDGTGGQTLPSSERENIVSVGGLAIADEVSRTVAMATVGRMTFEPSRITRSAGATESVEVPNTGQAVHERTARAATTWQERADAMAQNERTRTTLPLREIRQLSWRASDRTGGGRRPRPGSRSGSDAPRAHEDLAWVPTEVHRR